ncbi:hypothetical protein [Calidithermus chliarophilus]|uniref:hypothetical protein n=1 Tax=Calidithermus chliarophilus TaxID=52023 RepID=UPI000419D024|nr:hypothetical protein [Calidithermus chliarophilus]
MSLLPTNANGIPVPVAFPPSGTNFYVSPDGGPLELPPHTRFIEVTTTDSPAVVALGDRTVEAVEPGYNVTDGSAPRRVGAGQSLMIALRPGTTHVAVYSEGPVYLSYWGR